MKNPHKSIDAVLDQLTRQDPESFLLLDPSDKLHTYEYDEGHNKLEKALADNGFQYIGPKRMRKTDYVPGFFDRSSDKPNKNVKWFRKARDLFDRFGLEAIAVSFGYLDFTHKDPELSTLLSPNKSISETLFFDLTHDYSDHLVQHTIQHSAQGIRYHLYARPSRDVSEEILSLLAPKDRASYRMARHNDIDWVSARNAYRSLETTSAFLAKRRLVDPFTFHQYKDLSKRLFTSINFTREWLHPNPVIAELLAKSIEGLFRQDPVLKAGDVSDDSYKERLNASLKVLSSGFGAYGWKESYSADHEERKKVLKSLIKHRRHRMDCHIHNSETDLNNKYSAEHGREDIYQNIVSLKSAARDITRQIKSGSVNFGSFEEKHENLIFSIEELKNNGRSLYSKGSPLVNLISPILSDAYQFSLLSERYMQNHDQHG